MQYRYPWFIPGVHGTFGSLGPARPYLWHMLCLALVLNPVLFSPLHCERLGYLLIILAVRR